MATVFDESDSPITIVPRHLLAKYPNINDVPFNALPIGTGPFRGTSSSRGNQIELTRYNRSFLGVPKLKSIVIKLVPDESPRSRCCRRTRSGFYQASVNAYEALRRIPASDVRLVLVAIKGYEGLTFNSGRGRRPTSACGAPSPTRLTQRR